MVFFVENLIPDKTDSWQIQYQASGIFFQNLKNIRNYLIFN